jgi:uncharacterized membrane protein YcaP (DUF421 family)
VESLLNLDPTSLLVVALRACVVYLVLLGLLRVGGKRELGQLAPFDLVVLLVISNAVQNAMVGSDTSLTGGIVAAITLVALNWAVDRLAVRTPWLRRRVVGTPTLLVHQGELLLPHLVQEGVTEDEVLQALREHGVDELADVKSAVLEVDGTISVIPIDAPSTRTRRRLHARKRAG